MPIPRVVFHLGRCLIALYHLAIGWPIPKQRDRMRLYLLGAATDCFTYCDRETEICRWVPTYLALSREVHGPNPGGEAGAVVMGRQAQLGVVLWRISASEEGLGQFESALQWFQNNRAEATVVWAACIMNIGGDLLALNRLEEAAEWLQQAANLRRAIHGPDSFELAQCLNNLGVVYQELNRLEAAEAAGREALRLHERNSPGGVGATKALVNLAETLLKAGRAVEAEESARKALSYSVSSSSEVAAPIADTLSSIYEAQGRFPEALSALEHAIRVATEQGKYSLVNGYGPRRLALLERITVTRNSLAPEQQSPA